MTGPTLRALLPADTPSATPNQLIDIADACAALPAGWSPRRRDLVVASHMPRVLALVADQADRLAQIADNLTPCPPRGANRCAHGVWPCAITESAWLARGLDPATEVTAAVTAARSLVEALLAETPGPAGAAA